MADEPELPDSWGVTKYDHMTDDEYESCNPFGRPPPPGMPSDFAGLTEQDFMEMQVAVVVPGEAE